MTHNYVDNKLNTGHCAVCSLVAAVHSQPTELTSLREIKQRLANLEADLNVLKGVGQELLGGQDKLLQSHAAQQIQIEGLTKCVAAIERILGVDVRELRLAQNKLTVSYAALNANHKAIAAKLDAIQGELLHQQFQRGKQPKRKAGKGKGKGSK